MTEPTLALSEYSGLPICVTRHFPDVEHPEKVLLHDVTRLEVSNYQRKDIWLAAGKVNITENPLEPLTALQPLEIVAARTFSEGFTVTGITK